MKKRTELKYLMRIGIITAFAVLAFISTTIIRIPIPATGGYFNLGDIFIMLAALLYGPLIGFFVGLIGPTASDAIGFPQFIFATAIVKSMEGLIIGLVNSRNKNNQTGIAMFSLLIGSFIIVVGYYIFEAYIYPSIAVKIPFFGVTDLHAAKAEIVPNSIQGILSAIAALGIWRAFTWRKRN